MLNITIYRIRCIIGARPPDVGIVTDIWECKAEPSISTEVPAFVAMNVRFIHLLPTEEAQMRSMKSIACPVAERYGAMTQPFDPF